MALGQNILKIRKKNGLSQEQLGEKINVTRQTISNWELGETTPNTEQLKLLSKNLNVSIDELIDNDLHISNKKLSEKQTKVLKKTIKAIIIGFIIFLIVDIITFLICFIGHIGPFEKNSESSDNNLTYVCYNCYGMKGSI